MAVTAADVAAWGRFSVPTGVELTLLDRVILAATSRLGRDYYIDDPTTDDQDMAIILVSVRLWARRNSPEGRDAFGGDFAVSISPDDADAVSLLMPRSGLA